VIAALFELCDGAFVPVGEGVVAEQHDLEFFLEALLFGLVDDVP